MRLFNNQFVMKISGTHTRLTQFQLGRTIAEVMIALSLGLIIVAGVMGAFVSSQQSATQTNASAKLAQELIAVMSLLGQQIRQAGASDLDASTATGDLARRLTVPVISGCDSGYVMLRNRIPLVESSTPCSDEGLNSDALTLGSQVIAVNCTASGPIDYYSAQDYSNSSWGKDVLGQCVPAALNALPSAR
jgi:Tfp pilus assembly protein PilW